VKVGDLVHFPDQPIRMWGESPLTNGIVIGFDSEDDPIIFFSSRGSAHAYHIEDIEVISESR
jgi:hypothetical protein